MGVDKLLSEIERIGQIAGRWSAGAEISEIEREIVLDKLKHIYEEVIFLERGGVEDAPADCQAAEVGVPVAVARQTEEAPACSEHNEPAPELFPVSEAPAESAPLGEGAPVESRTEEAPDTPADMPEEMPEDAPLMEEVEEIEVAVTFEQQQQQQQPELQNPESQHIEPQNIEPQNLEQKLFCDEPMVRSRVDKKVILSLYGESTTSHHVSHTTHTQYRSAVPQPVEAQEPSEPAAGASASAAQPDTASFTPVAGPASEGTSYRKVLGETLGAPAAAINEVLGKKAVHTDVASRLRASRISDLRHSIGINDRFLLIRDLFGGRAAEFDRVIGELDAFTALDDAMIYIQENFEWDPDGEAASLLVELLERKLEQ